MADTNPGELQDEPEPNQALKDAVDVWRAARGDQNARRRAKRHVEKLCKEQGITPVFLLYPGPQPVTEVRVRETVRRRGGRATVAAQQGSSQDTTGRQA